MKSNQPPRLQNYLLFQPVLVFKHPMILARWTTSYGPSAVKKTKRVSDEWVASMLKEPGAVLVKKKLFVS